MRHDNDGEPLLVSQLEQQVEEPLLGARVEACDRFVEYAKARPAKLVEYLTMAFQLTDAQAQAYFAGVR